jgi:hypothetical protein
MIKKQFRALVHVCMASGSVVRNLVPAMRMEAEAFLAPRLTDQDVVEMFLAKARAGSKDLPTADCEESELLSVFDEAAPGLASAGDVEELRIVALPSSQGNDSFRALTQRALSNREVHFATSVDEIIFYREQLHTELDSLYQPSRQAQETYQQMMDQEGQNPHNRTDITDWRKLAATRQS